MVTPGGRWMLLVGILVALGPGVNSECQSCSGDCRLEKVDLTFVVDGSGSICEGQEIDKGCREWVRILDSMVSMLDYFNVGPDSDRVALVQFANEGKLEFGLTAYSDKASIVAAIKSLEHMAGNTNTSGGLNVMRTQSYTTFSGDRENVADVSIVITDGKSTYDREKTLPEAELARQAGIRIYAIGVTNEIDVNELRRISSAPQIVNLTYFLAPSYVMLQLPVVVEAIHSSFCKSYSINNNINCPGTFSHTGCYVVTEALLSWLGAQSECANIASQIGRPGMGELVSISSQPLQEEMDWLVRTTWTRKPVTSVLTSFWIGGRRDNRNAFPVWKWIGTSGQTTVEPQGCFADRATNPDLPYMKDFGAEPLLPANCTSHCAMMNYTVAGLQNGRVCYCGHSYGQYGGSKECTVECTGARSGSGVFCGGSAENNIFSIGGGYGEWMPFRPNNYDATQGGCGGLDGRWGTWLMTDEVCHKKTAYICHLPNFSPCYEVQQNGGAIRPIGSRCVFVSQDPSDTGLKSWFSANSACRDMGGELLTIRDKAEYDQLRNVLNNLGRPPLDLYWVGLVGRQWTWTSDAELVYQNWGPDQPSDVTKDCMTFTYSTSTNEITWESAQCTQNLPSICRIDITTTAPTPVTSTAAAATTTQGPTTTNNGTVNEPAPALGASTGVGGGLGIVEIVVIVLLVGLVIVGIIIGIIACYHKKKGNTKSQVVHPDKADYLSANILVPYNQYYEKENYTYDNPPSSGLVIDAATLTKTKTVSDGGEDHAYLSFTGGAQTTYGVMEPRNSVKYSSRSKTYENGAMTSGDATMGASMTSRGSRRMMSRDTSNMAISLDGTRISMTE